MTSAKIEFIGPNDPLCTRGTAEPHISVKLEGLNFAQAGALAQGVEADRAHIEDGFEAKYVGDEKNVTISTGFKNADAAERFVVAAVREADLPRAQTMEALRAAKTAFLALDKSVAA